MPMTPESWKQGWPWEGKRERTRRVNPLRRKIREKDAEIERLRKELEFWTNPDNHRRPTVSEARAKYGRDPTVAFRCGRMVMEAGPGQALSPVELKFIDLLHPQAAVKAGEHA